MGTAFSLTEAVKREIAKKFTDPGRGKGNSDVMFEYGYLSLPSDEKREIRQYVDEIIDAKKGMGPGFASWYNTFFAMGGMGIKGEIHDFASRHPGKERPNDEEEIFTNNSEAWYGGDNNPSLDKLVRLSNGALTTAEPFEQIYSDGTTRVAYKVNMPGMSGTQRIAHYDPTSDKYRISFTNEPIEIIE